MSKPRNKWWSYIRRILYEYPRMRAELDALQAPLQSHGEGGGHGSGTGRPAEALALRVLPDKQEQRELEAVEAALRVVQARPDGEITVQLVRLVFWQRTHTLEGAAQTVHVSYRTARRKVNGFLVLVAENMGLTEKLAPKSQNSDVN
ncbi:MAG: hypothetical protein LUD84_09610 [Clostridiales bacterium]|nr:hypothetical protein [Clostridiales bacterium]